MVELYVLLYEDISEDQQPGSARVLQQLMLKSVACSGATRGNLKLAVDRSQVPVDGAWANNELLGDLGVGHPLRHQA